MDPETLEALKGSIAKWERVVTKGTDGTNWMDCPLCDLFWENGCMGCPVRDRTKQRVCLGSPFEVYADLRDTLIEDDEIDPNQVGKHPGVIASAKDELDFLKSLLPRQLP
jgi:hypothetical protein